LFIIFGGKTLCEKLGDENRTRASKNNMNKKGYRNTVPQGLRKLAPVDTKTSVTPKRGIESGGGSRKPIAKARSSSQKFGCKD
jgi:hypothetical protein